MESSLTQAQKVLNQRLLSERCMDEPTITALYAGISEHFDNEGITTVQDAISISNQQLRSQLGFEIIAVVVPNVDEKNKNTKYYALVNATTTDEVGTKAALHALSFPQGLAEQVLITTMLQLLVEKKTVSKNTLINLRTEAVENLEDQDKPPPPLSLSAAQDTLDRLLQDKWIVASTSSSCRLGPRAFCELSHYLTEELGMDPEDVPQRITL